MTRKLSFPNGISIALRADLAERALELGIDLEHVVEAAVAQAITQAENRAWLEAHRRDVDERRGRERRNLQ